MQRITEQTLQEIEKRFKTERGYILSSDSPIYCPQVNGLTNICLSELGLSNKSRENSQKFLESASYNHTKGLFYREVDLEGRVVVPAFNTCKNSIFALSLAANRLNEEAEKIMDSLKLPLYLKEQGLFGREYNPETNEANPLIITQSNLWAALAYIKVGRLKEAKDLIKNLENKRYSQDCRLFDSQDCRGDSYQKRFFLDDQALGVLTYLEIGQEKKAKKLMQAILNSPLYDAKSDLFNSSFLDLDIDRTKSTYKNSLMAFALGRLGYNKQLKRIQVGLVRELYNPNERLFDQTTRDKTKVPDNSTLALVAIEYDNLKHKIF